MFGFPNPVNEKAARVVAACVAVLGAIVLATGAYWLVAVIAVGFALRVASGPRFSPLGLFATKVAAPRLGEPKLVAGPPKRFAQAMGLAMTSAAAVAALAFGAEGVADALLVALIVAATLESVFALCLGCRLFALLMRIGVIPDRVCADCANFWARAA
jgi:Domain of unknown function (DUF4395)